MMYVNEDGIAKKLPPNKEATKLYPGAVYEIFGDVVLLSKEKTEKESKSAE